VKELPRTLPAPPVVPGKEARSPDDFELFLETILEAPRQAAPGTRYVPASRQAPAGCPGPCCGAACVPAGEKDRPKLEPVPATRAIPVEPPKGRAPRALKVVAVAADHLVLEYALPVTGGSQVLATFRPALKDLRVFDRDGKPLHEAAWRQRIKPGVQVYGAADDRPVDLAHLRPEEKDALVVRGWW
jgi:hypothetical protein